MLKVLVPAILALSQICATEEAPWIDRVLEPVASLELGYQYFNKLGHCRYPGNDFFGNAGLLFAISPDLCFEVEARITSTHRHGLALDQVKQTARYAYLDDARGDLVAMTFGLELVEPISPFGLKDPSFIHHSIFDTELHVAVGKEWIHEDEYIWRMYGLAAVGVGVEGSPWMRGNFVAEHQYCLAHILRGKLIGEGGFGRNNVHRQNFHGYGPIAYRLVDVELEYAYAFNCFDLSFRYLKSLYRHNCPANLQQISLVLSYPFNL